MDFIVCLAHFCEVHGPTSILCTQVLPISCGTCFPPDPTPQAANGTAAHLSQPTPPPPVRDAPLEPKDKDRDSRRRLSAEQHSRQPSFSRRAQAPTVSQKSALLNQHLQQEADGQGSVIGASYTSSQLSSPFQSPPSSPHSPLPHDMYFGGSLSSIESATRYGAAGPVGPLGNSSSETCPSCSLSVPKSVSEQLPDGAPGSPSKDGRGKNGSPVLRTREAFLSSGITEERSDDEESATAEKATLKKRKGKASSAGISRPKPSRAASSSSSASESPDRSRASTMTTSSSSSPHPHTLTYLTARQPSSRDAHSLLRRSCIRTLSCEQLPRANKGPLFFGDDRAGYTIAFVFRLCDPCARGRSRRYAFVCWAGREERRAARAWKEVIGVFESMAIRIESMVERQQEGSARASDGVGSVEARSGSRDITPVSSFLSGRTVDPDGYPRRASVRAKGLAELVGREDFFVEVHAVFVRLLTRLGRGFGGFPAGAVVDSAIHGEVGETDEPGEVTGLRNLSLRGPHLERKVSDSANSKPTFDTVVNVSLELGSRQQLVA